MKKLFVFALLFCCATLYLNAQAPANDECASAIQLGFAPTCDTTIVYSNENATTSVIGIDNNPSCFNGGIPSRDVWFSFVCPSNVFDFRVTIFGVGANSILNPQVAVYRGDCNFDELFELDCAKADLGENGIFVDLFGLTPNVTYYLRVSDYSLSATPNSGDFKLCVSEVPEVISIADGSSNLCSGVISDSGGENGDYSSNEDYVFTICPNQPTSCITFTLDYYNLELVPGFTGGGDALIIYDGSTTTSPQLANISYVSNAFNNTGGAVCYTVTGSSSCMTLRFMSDESVEQEGFLGHWECSNQPCPAPENITLNNPITNQTIVNAVTTAATQVTITNIDCNPLAYGAFSYPTINNDLQIEKGIVLASGEVNDILNIAGFNASEILDEPGDPDLDYLSVLQGGQESYDACVVEMDVFAATDQLSFEYVFGSEEYPEFVFAQGGFNDIFAFLVSGPGIVGDPNMGNQKNIAIIPGTNTPVEINTVNNQVNWEYYRNTLTNPDLVYDGLTSDFMGIKKTLTARTEVTPCFTYHLKLAIADRGDASFDSGVFISEIKGGTPNLEVLFASGIDYFIEGCSGVEDKLIISLSEPLTQPTSFFINIGGTATLGVDYALNIPSVITFNPGETQLEFPIIPLTDALTEGTETIVISLSNDFGCGVVLLKTITIDLLDNANVDVNAGADTLFTCPNQPLQLVAEGASDYFWSPPNAVSNPLIANPTITTTSDITLIVTGSIETCISYDTVYIKVVVPKMELFASDTSICLGESVNLLAVNNAGNTGLLWSPATGLSNPSINNPVASPVTTTTYSVSVNLAGCSAVDMVTISVDTLFFPEIYITDTTVCQNYPVLLASEVSGTTSFQWTPAAGLSDAEISNPIALPDQTTTYTLVATSSNGNCSQTASATVNVINANIEIAGPENYEICLGTLVSLQATATPQGGAPVTWTPAFYATPSTGPNTTINADESVTIIATYNVNNCLVFDSVHIRVDSLPDLSLSLRPAKDIYCPGDTVTLLSPTYEPANFPDIQNMWLPEGLGQITPDSLWNLVIRAQETDTFYRITMNRGCLDTASIIVPVDSIPTITISASDLMLCPGETSMLLATVVPDQKLMWDPPTGLSCVECPNPSATPLTSTQFSVTTPDANCPASASIFIEVLPAPLLSLPNNPTLCEGDTLVLNNAPSEPNTTYSWVSTPPGFTSSIAQPFITGIASGSYMVTATNSSCTSTGSVTVTVPFATVDAGANITICRGQAINLNASSDGAIGAFAWTSSTGGAVLTGPNPSVNPEITTVYTVTFTFSAANCQVSDNMTVTVNPAPEILAMVMNPVDGKVCEGDILTIKSTNFGGTPPLVYAWTQDGQPVAPNAQDSVSLTFLGGEEPINYTVALTITDAAGCSSTESVVAEVRRCFNIPNAFTPNGDSANDDFGIVTFGEGIRVNKITIYNRWGQKVFTGDASNSRWNGNVDGKPAPVDVYVYQIDITRPDGSTEGFTGEVTLLR